MIELFNLKLIYEKEITCAICILQPSRLNWSGRLPLRHLSGAGRAWNVRECVAPIEANGATFRRKIRHRAEFLLTLLLPRYGRAERPVFTSRQRRPVPLHDPIHRERDAAAADARPRPAFPDECTANTDPARGGDEGTNRSYSGHESSVGPRTKCLALFSSVA